MYKKEQYLARGVNCPLSIGRIYVGVSCNWDLHGLVLFFIKIDGLGQAGGAGGAGGEKNFE